MESTDNPYIQLPNAADPSLYFGSLNMVRTVLQTISSSTPRALELLAMPGMGKSSLLRYIAHPQGALKAHPEFLHEEFQDHQMLLLPILVEYRNRPYNIHPYQFLLGRLRAEVERQNTITTAEVRTLLSELELGFERKIATNDYLPNGLRAANYITQIVYTLVNSGAHIRPVFLLDDFDLAIAGFSRDEMDRARPWREHVSFILSVEQRISRLPSEAAGSSFFQMVPLVRLGPLDVAEARRLLTEPVDELFPQADQDLLLEYSGLHPNLLILGGAALWDLRNQLKLLDRTDEAVPAKHIPILRGRLEQDYFNVYSLYWGRLEKTEKDAIQASGSSKELSEQHKSRLGNLAGLGLLKYNSEAGTYEPFSPLFQEFVRSQTGSEQDELTELESRLFDYLAQQPNQVATFEDIWARVWDRTDKYNAAGETDIRRPIQVAVSRLRKKIEGTGNDIASVRDLGYRFIPAPRND